MCIIFIQISVGVSAAVIVVAVIAVIVIAVIVRVVGVPCVIIIAIAVKRWRNSSVSESSENLCMYYVDLCSLSHKLSIPLVASYTHKHSHH